MSWFPKALPVILDHEGGFADHPDDPGGATMRGITQATFSNWLRDNGHESRHVREITDAEIEAIYHDRYWKAAHCDEIGWPLSLAHFDAAVNHGVARAIKLLQAAAGTETDGVWGPKTRAAVLRRDADELLEDVLWRRLRFYVDITVRRPQNRSFITGWVLRAIRLRERCLTEIISNARLDPSGAD